jgi:hypothetical protein
VHLFGTRIGYKLMLIESGILIEALQGFAAKGITALPLHEGVLVACQRRKRHERSWRPLSASSWTMLARS